MADPTLRFKPQEQYVLPSALAAEGGRIGYADGYEVQPAAFVKPEFTKKQPFYNEPLDFQRGGLYNLRLNSLGSSELQNLYQNLRSKDMTVGKLLEELQTGKYDKLPEKITSELKEHVLKKVDFGDTFQENWSMGVVEPTFKDNRLDIEEGDLETEEMPVRPEDVLELAQGGRIGYDEGKLVAGVDTPAIDLEDLPGLLNEFFEEYGRNPGSMDELKRFRRDHPADDPGYVEGAQGGRIGAQEGGLMDLGGMEKDYRQEGGFVPIGGQERADDVPARLSKNEFVFTADAVRAAGGGDIDAGAEVMENVMENLEQGGQVSEESQGLEGAKNMFATAQRLEGVM